MLDLNSQTVAQLREKATGMGISLKSKMLKQDIIDLINNAEDVRVEEIANHNPEIEAPVFVERKLNRHQRRKKIKLARMRG